MVFIFVAFVLPLAANDDMVNYGYLSYIEGTPEVIRVDGTKDKGKVNLPLAPGDTIITGPKDRCEIQFDNGTVTRMDKSSELKVITLLAESLTSKRKLTTLKLEKGELYTIAKKYNNETFQIITPNTAVMMPKFSNNTIALCNHKETRIWVQSGKVKVMFGDKLENMKKETIKRRNGYRITADNKFVIDRKKDEDFQIWNQEINKNHKELHYGLSKVPKAIYRYNKGIVRWAEKWSSIYGEWIYDDLFGYVWKPYDETFGITHRPFHDAEFVRVNGKLFLVPQQKWGWGPAHLGTWVWMGDRGWTWVPSNVFTSGAGHYSAFSYGQRFYWSLWQGANERYHYDYRYWIYGAYGSMDLYYIYLNQGNSAWQDAFEKHYGQRPEKPMIKKLPKGIKALIKKINKKPVHLIKSKLGNQKPAPIKMQQPIRKLNKGKIIRPVPALAQLVTLKNSHLDWNRDKKILKGKGIQYIPSKNVVACKDLNIYSNKLNARDRRGLVKVNTDPFHSTFIGNKGGNNAHNTPTNTRSQDRSGRTGAVKK